jgi:hypothetical protein
MKKSIFVALIFFTGIINVSGQSDYAGEWNEVESFVKKGLPQSALKLVEQIFASSKAENNAPQFLKAAIYKISLQSQYQEDFMENGLNLILREIETAQEPAKQILHSVVAELYWRYYQSNRYLFMDRTTVSEPDPGDIKTWDVAALVRAVHRHYLESLENPQILQQTELGLFDPILEQEKGSRVYRPSLYDFLAHRALDFFMNEETGLTLPTETFNINKKECFLPAAEFAGIMLDAPGNNAFKLEALKILRELIRFHLNDADPAALIDADLKRLKFVEGNAVMPERYDLFLGALQNLQNAHPTHPNSTDAAYEIALEYLRRGAQYNPFISEDYRWDIKNATETCDKALASFPGSDGAKNCAILLDGILEPSLYFRMNYANLPENPALASLDFKNLSKAYFRIIPFDPKEDRQLRQQDRHNARIDRYKSIAPIQSWTLNLPDAGDYQEHTTQIRIPDLPKGYYVILASDNPEFAYNDRIVTHASFWVTGISYVYDLVQDEARMQIFVLDRQKGTPLAGVKADAYTREYDYPSRTYQDRLLESYVSGPDGQVIVPRGTNNSKSFYMEFSNADDRFYTENYFYIYPLQPEEKSRLNAYFFTDRSIYRPGQTIYFKGIILEQQGEKSEIRPDLPVEVALHDANGQKVSEMLLTTNEFGSFNGVFTAPSGGLTGEMTIRCTHGSVSVAVEEYKRPKFKVKIDSLEGNYRLNETVTVTGQAMAYAGNAIDQATVSYRVVRTARFPVWGDWYWFPDVPETEILSGQTRTNADGSFGFTFTAYPDLQVDPKFTPVFSYRIYADVTDISGEVRSAEEVVSVGYQALVLEVNIPEKVNGKGERTFKLTATNLNGRPVRAAGKVTVYPLQSPSRLLRDRSWERPDVFVMTEPEFRKEFPNEIYSNENDPETWTKGKPVQSGVFDSETDSVIALDDLSEWDAGMYLMVLETTDAFGQKVEVKKYFTVFGPGDLKMPVSKPFWLTALKSSGEPGDTAVFLAGTAEKNVRLLVEVVRGGEKILHQWKDLSQEKQRISIPIQEEDRGNIFVNFLLVKENRAYQATEVVTVPYTDRELKITTETFRSELTPGQTEEWRIRISGMKGEQVAAELLASMYDASLDAFRGHSWNFKLYDYRYPPTIWNSGDAFKTISNEVFRLGKISDWAPVIRAYDRLNWFGFSYYGSPSPWRGGREGMMMKSFDAAAAPGMADQEQTVAEEVVAFDLEQPPAPEAPKVPDVPVRRNFDETAFFFPALMTDANGDAILKFTVPESLTAWKFMLLAYTKDLKTGQLEKEVVTRKDLMVMPNPPRFFREGDKISFSAKVVSMAAQRLEGQITAEFFDARTMQPIDENLGNLLVNQSFSVEKGSSRVFFWEITIPEGLEAIVCRVKAVSGTMGDGEEFVIPVLPNRMLVTESLPLPIGGGSTRNFTLDKLVNSGSSSSLKNYRLTLEFTSNPAWYAVQALPYLSEGQHESADNVFTRYYANSIASFIANSDPKIRQVFDTWKDLSPDAFLSNLEKNQQLKSVLLNETPWVTEARDESERKKRIAVLFDLNRISNEQTTVLRKLEQMQSPNGGWPWFEGMPDNRYITQLILSGFGKLQHLGVIDLEKDQELAGMVRRSLLYMDQRIKEDYEDLMAMDKVDLKANHLGASQVQYLYARSLLKNMAEVNPEAREAFDYYIEQAGKYWLKQDKYLQGMIALALHRFEVAEVPEDILNSLRENALWDEEMGLYWRDAGGYYWYQAPIERQALMIEAFEEVAEDLGAVEQLKMWLLKQKQTQDWKTPRATAEAIYALLLQGTGLLASDRLVDVTVGSVKVEPLNFDGVQVQAGTGYYQTSWYGKEIASKMGNVTVSKKDEGIAWGALYWQYYEDLDRITPAQSPLSLEKELYIQRNTPSGPVLEQVHDTTVLQTGDKVKVRVVIRTDRDLEFVHMKDMRAPAFEPAEVMSGYRYQGGMGYYESIRDASVNFFFDYLRKGTYVFEYPLNVTQKGEFSNGITSIQCLYAPEFAAHSQGIRVKVE